MTTKPFGKQLRSLREAAGLSQAALGKALGIHPVCISQYEAAVNVPREKRKAAILAYFKTGEVPADDPPAKKRGRPRKVEAGESLPEERKKRCAKWGRPKKVAEVIEQKVVVELSDAPKPSRRENCDSAITKSPVRLGQVNLAWIEQMADAHVHSRGAQIIENSSRVVMLRRCDLLDLCRALIEACGTKVG